jgi:hypothetical protein
MEEAIKRDMRARRRKGYKVKGYLKILGAKVYD